MAHAVLRGPEENGGSRARMRFLAVLRRKSALFITVASALENQFWVNHNA
jgi:hypothetical protein